VEALWGAKLSILSQVLGGLVFFERIGGLALGKLAKRRGAE